MHVFGFESQILMEGEGHEGCQHVSLHYHCGFRRASCAASEAERVNVLGVDGDPFVAG